MIRLQTGQIVEDVHGNKYLIEKNDVLQEALNVDHLNDVELSNKLIDFIKLNPFPTDDKLHKFAKENGYDPDEVEAYAYAFLTIILTGGKSRGHEFPVDSFNYDVGIKIEQEHVSCDIENPVIENIQRRLASKILRDHIAEDSSYYENELFLAELEKEVQ